MNNLVTLCGRVFAGSAMAVAIFLWTTLLPISLDAGQASQGRGVPVVSPQGGPPTPGAPGGRAGTLYHQLEPDDLTGFVEIFDGKTLTGWDGDPTFWRVQDGAIVAESTPEKVVRQNTFLIWRGETLRDFELKVEFRMNGTNSGIQVRSMELPAVGKWVLKGYQADVEFNNGFTGNIHEERGRNVLVPRGQVVRIVEGPRYKSLGTINDNTLLRGAMNVNDWNLYHIIARGPILMQLLNGQLMAVLIDEDVTNRALEGVLGFQMHVGAPFKVEYRNIWYRKL